MWTTMESPVGVLRLVAEHGALRAVQFLDAPESAGEPAEGDPVLGEAARQLSAYFAGDLKEFDLPLAPHGTPFQLRVWEQLRQIPFGETTTYGALAGRLGLTGHGARAVGLANGRNPIPVIVPCHRVIGTNGTLTGYAGGLARKQVLLDLEQATLF